MTAAVPDPFERLDLPRRFFVDPAALEREYLTRSRLAHPDYHHGGSAAEQQASLDESAALNEAYQTLRDPARRAECLLALLGGPTAAEDKSQDQAFLMAMMDFRERIEAGPSAEVADELTRLEAGTLARIGGEFERLAADPGHGLRAVRRLLNEVKTIRGLLRDVE